MQWCITSNHEVRSTFAAVVVTMVLPRAEALRVEPVKLPRVANEDNKFEMFALPRECIHGLIILLLHDFDGRFEAVLVDLSCTLEDVVHVPCTDCRDPKSAPSEQEVSAPYSGRFGEIVVFLLLVQSFEAFKFRLKGVLKFGNSALLTITCQRHFQAVRLLSKACRSTSCVKLASRCLEAAEWLQLR